MEVLLSKLSYRLYEMESYCLSYENFPLDSLIEIKEGLDWLQSSMSNLPCLTQLESLLNQLTQFVSCLQQRLSPFSSSYRDLFLELIDLVRQLVLEQAYYAYCDIQLSTKPEQIAQLIERVQQEHASILQPSQALNKFEAKLEQDDDAWLTILMDFIERFSRVGEFTFEGNLSYKTDIGLKADSSLHQAGLAPILKVDAKTAQSLAWMNRHFSQFKWHISNQTISLSIKDLRPVFDCLRQAKVLIQKHDQKHFSYAYAYQVLETTYIATQADSLGNIADKLSDKLGFSVVSLPTQAGIYVEDLVVSTLLNDIFSLFNSHSPFNCQSFTLFTQDVSGKSRLMVASNLMDSKPKRYCLESSEYADRGLIIDLPYALSVLEYKVWLASSSDGFICVPDSKVHSILVWNNEVLSTDLSQNYMSVLIEDVGQVDVFIGSREILDSQTQKNVILINDLGDMYGVLVEEVDVKHHVYKVPSMGLSPGVNMLWYFDQVGIVAEINPNALMKPEIEYVASQKDKPDLVGVGGWIAKIAGMHCFIHPEVVEKHLTTDNAVNVTLSYVDSPFIQLEGRCYPYFDCVKGDASSLLLLVWRDESVCIAVNSIYYQKNIDDTLLRLDGVERLTLHDLSLIDEKMNENVLYVIDANSF